MKHKLAALLAVLLLMCSVLPVGVYAATAKNTTTVTAKCTIPDVTIDVTVPTATSTVLNPKSLTVNVGGGIQPKSTDQIVTGVTYLTNQSEVPVTVDVSMTGTINKNSDMKLTTTSTKGTSLTTKSAFVYFEIVATDEDGLGEDLDLSGVTWADEYDATKHVLLSTSTKKLTNIVTLEEAGEDKKCYGAFRLTGDCVASPKNTLWSTTDGFTAKVVFTFTAQSLIES